MGSNSAIEWTHHTFNPWRGCTKVSPGCANCYAEKLSARNPATLGTWGDNGTRVIAAESYWREPLKWNKAAQAAGERHRVFCASLADVFEDRPELEEPRMRLWNLIYNTPHLDWLLLTKRPQNAFDMIGGTSGAGLAVLEEMRNLWIGVSVENQEQADARIPILLQIPAAVRFLSCEPLLGPVYLSNPSWLGLKGKFYHIQPRIHWVIAGGESGPNARPLHPEWATSLRDQCQAAGVAFHFKQWGEWLPYEPERAPFWLGQHGGVIDGHSFPGDLSEAKPTGSGTECWWAPWPHEGDVVFRKAGKRLAGRLLDGRTWDEFPEVAR